MAEACCYPNDQCVDLTYDDCLAGGGLPMGVGSRCGVYGIRSCTFQACCWTPGIPGSSPICDNLPPNDCLEIGGDPLGRGVRCEMIVGLGCELIGIELDCCMPDGSRIREILAPYCLAARGTPAMSTDECPPPPVEEECRLPRDDEVVGPIWSLELCAPAYMLPGIAEEGIDGYRPGYGRLVTTHGVRNDFDAPPCNPAASTLFLDARNYGSPVFCSRQQRYLRVWRGHEGVAVLQGETGDRITRPGYGVAVSAYDAPDWSETTVGSIRLRCWGAPI